MRVNLNIDDELLKKIDDYASEKYVNRTAAISVLLSTALQANDVQKAVVKMGDIRDFFDSLTTEDK